MNKTIMTGGLLLLGALMISQRKLQLYKDQPRGIRNNNPLNIRENAQTDYEWQGERSTNDDAAFEEFIDPIYGIRAGARVLKSYRRRGIVTLADIVTTWAPPTENNTSSYIGSVAAATGLDRWTEIQEHHYPDLIAAMIHHENGIQPYSMELIKAGVTMA